MAKQTLISKPYDQIGKQRVIIEHVTPQVESGQYPVKRVEGEWLIVDADVFIDGHDDVRATLLHRVKGARKWNQEVMHSVGNDRWRAAFHLDATGEYEYTIQGNIDHAASWQHAFRKRLSEKDEKELQVQIAIGKQFLETVAKRYTKSKVAVKEWIKRLDSDQGYDHASGSELETFFAQFPVIDFETIYNQTLTCVAHRKRAGFSAWYSFFPRSSAPFGKEHGTFKDCETLVPRIKEMGFDVVYLPPIHPIGHAFRKGRNNTLNVQPDEPGCPYATGNELGGHKAILPELGTLIDFKSLIKKIESVEMEIAMDFAIQCSPDHPYVKEHPQWFKWRPDGSVQYAENPPKKYQDVLPLDFENQDWQNMWLELKNILDYWIEQGVKIFRVDNPHTKSFLFWQWCLAEIHKSNPEVIFLSEAFTRPRVMENLAKKGFHQSYTYYTWRNSKQELMQYMNDLTQTNMREYFRPNFWPNTHDINPYITQSNNEAQYLIRYFMAATLSSNYGIFGPCFELMDHSAIPGKEEYYDSEKYQVRHWDWVKRNKVTRIITMVNRFRNENAALQFTNNYIECSILNDQMLAYLKVQGDNKILCVVNIDSNQRQQGSLTLTYDQVGKVYGSSYVVHDLITGDQYNWKGEQHFIELDPNRLPFHLFKIEG